MAGETFQMAPPSRRPGEPFLAFVHIPRTGGGTVKSAIARNYARPKSPGNIQTSPERTRNGIAALARSLHRWQAAADHVPLGLYERYLTGDTRYLTILRDPVEHVLSQYYFAENWGGQMVMWQHLAAIERRVNGSTEGGQRSVLFTEEDDYSLEAGLRLGICLYNNLQTRFLWGGEHIHGSLPVDALDRAKENLERLWFVGVTERLDESIVLLGRKLGIGLMPYSLTHVAKNRPPREELSPSLRELILEHNALDVELHRFARERFDAQAPPEEELMAEADELRRARDVPPPETAETRAARKARKAGVRVAKPHRRGGKGAAAAEEGTAPRRRQKRDAAAAEPAPGAETGSAAEAVILERLRLVEDRLHRLERRMLRADAQAAAEALSEEPEAEGTGSDG